MKNLNRYLSILALVVVSGTPLLNKPVTATEAALTAPASYDIAFQYSAAGGGLAAGHKYTDGSGGNKSQPRFTRTADGVYYNYTHTQLGGSANLPEGLDITMTFNRSNTTWSAATPSGYYATDTKIGSDNTVGSTARKYAVKLTNNTSKEYLFYVDVSSTNSDTEFLLTYDGETVITMNGTVYQNHTHLKVFFIPAFVEIEYRTTTTSGNRYLDAWYLKDLGVSDAWQEGYDQGESDGYTDGYENGYNNSASPLWDGLEVVVGVTVNFILFIMTLSIFDISLLNIGIVLVSILGIVWVLKALRG